jgi:hypothetical protein
MTIGWLQCSSAVVHLVAPPALTSLALLLLLLLLLLPLLQVLLWALVASACGWCGTMRERCGIPSLQRHRHF